MSLYLICSDGQPGLFWHDTHTLKRLLGARTKVIICKQAFATHHNICLQRLDDT
jgi:hypothetical protein